MRLVLSTAWRMPAEAPTGFLERLEALCDDASAGGIGLCGLELDPHLREPEYRALAEGGRRLGLPVVSVRCYSPIPDLLPRRHLGGTEVFSPSSADPEERRLAVREGRRVLEQAATLGAEQVVIDLGRVGNGLGSHLGRLWRGFARGRFDDDRDGPGDREMAKLLEERSAMAGPFLDRVRACLGAWLDEASRLGIRVALTNRVRPDEIPTAMEALLLFDEFRGAPLGYVHDTGRAHVAAALVPRQSEWLALVAPGRLCGVTLHDACGPLLRLPVGTGEAELGPAVRLAAPPPVAPEPTSPQPAGTPAPVPGPPQPPQLPPVIPPTADEIARYRRPADLLPIVLMVTPNVTVAELRRGARHTRGLTGRG